MTLNVLFIVTVGYIFFKLINQIHTFRKNSLIVEFYEKYGK